MTLTAAALFTQTQSLSPALSLSPRTTLVGQPPSNPLSPPSALTLYRKPSVDAHSLSQTLNRHSSLHGSAPVALSYPSLKSSRRHLPLPHSLHLRQPLLAFTAPCGSAQLLLCDAYDLFYISLVTKLPGRIYYIDIKDPKPPNVQAAMTGVVLCGTLAGQLFFGCLDDKMRSINYFQGEPEPFRNKKQVVEAIGGNPFSGYSHILKAWPYIPLLARF
ncbi:hypothetical protein Ahy_A07g036848 isoform A [Arachis hypogaea]|uniref:Uncharacterized protein n=1 Tax=Arachis hypogaea TaxID=3818 RepID=A0A445CH36_ARAHY|nr:hypothetical protein Ahy_A07g036848 isoform A [Arachis hypogaea]